MKGLKVVGDGAINLSHAVSHWRKASAICIITDESMVMIMMNMRGVACIISDAERQVAKPEITLDLMV